MISTLLLCACSGHTSSFHIAKYRNKWVFINYWATWCESCKLEIPALNAFAKQHSKNVVVLGVNYDNLQGDALKQAIQKMHITFKVLKADPGECLKLETVNVVPTTFVFAPQGHWVATLVGPQNQHSLTKIIHP